MTLILFYYFTPNFSRFRTGFLPKRAFHCTKSNSLEKTNSWLANKLISWLLTRRHRKSGPNRHCHLNPLSFWRKDSQQPFFKVLWHVMELEKTPMDLKFLFWKMGAKSNIQWFLQHTTYMVILWVKYYSSHICQLSTCNTAFYPFSQLTVPKIYLFSLAFSTQSVFFGNLNIFLQMVKS